MARHEVYKKNNQRRNKLIMAMRQINFTLIVSLLNLAVLLYIFSRYV